MGSPISFKEANYTWFAVGERHRPHMFVQRHGSDVMSCWRLSLWERLRVLLTGRVWCGTAGTPPVTVGARHPFARPGRQE